MRAHGRNELRDEQEKQMRDLAMRRLTRMRGPLTHDLGIGSDPGPEEDPNTPGAGGAKPRFGLGVRRLNNQRYQRHKECGDTPPEHGHPASQIDDDDSDDGGGRPSPQLPGVVGRPGVS